MTPTIPCLPVTEAQTRRAFFLVNSEYQRLNPLPVNSAGLGKLRSALTAQSFLGKGSDSTLLKGAKAGDTMLIYNYGYAVQADRGNFLLPIDFEPGRTEIVADRARSVNGLIQLLQVGGIGVKVLLIDAATQPNVPIQRQSNTGLGEPDFTDISEVTYVAGAVKNAPPIPLNDTERGLFIKHLAALIAKPGTLLSDLTAKIPGAVAAESGGKLLPYTSTQASLPFQFTAPPPPPAPIIITERVPVDTFLSQAQMNRQDRQEYRHIPAGKFLMGCAEGDNKCEDHEKPQHAVTITKAFWIGETEVQVEAYQKFVDTAVPKRKMPMAAVSPENAAAFCTWVGGRLPTEAEWEYAARGGKPNEIVPMSAENAREKANFSGVKGNDRFPEVAPVRKFDPNGFGLFDMSGNLWELTSDFYSKTYFAESPKEDPKGPPPGKERVLRGGSWYSDAAQHLRISFRKAGNGANNVGFRCVLPDTEETRKLLRQ